MFEGHYCIVMSLYQFTLLELMMGPKFDNNNNKLEIKNENSSLINNDITKNTFLYQPR